MIIHMRFGTKIFTVLVMLFVLTWQVMASAGVSSCEMDMHDMAMMDHGSMDMSHDGMDKMSMDCCDDSCEMQCAVSITVALIDTGSFETLSMTSSQIISLKHMMISNIITSLYHPPISA